MSVQRLSASLLSLCDKVSLLSLVSGLLIALSFPLTGLSFLAWIALIPLLYALEDRPLRTAFRAGFTCGLAAYAGLLYWINIVITHYGHLPWAVSIPLYLILITWLALFFGAAVMGAQYARQVSMPMAVSLPLLWVAGDLLRSFLLSGFPWAMLGHSQFRTLPLIQIADITGVYGITLLLVLANVVLYQLLRTVTDRNSPFPVVSLICTVMLLTATMGYGFFRLNAPRKHTSTPLRVALIQGNIDQDIKWSPAFQDQTVAIYERLSRAAAREKPDLIVWPESAAPFFFQDEQPHSLAIRSLAREFNAALLVGSPAYEYRAGKRTFLNSAFMLAPDGSTTGRSDKMHLVPFGEYVPMGRFFPFINKIVVGIGDFSPGQRVVPLPVAHTSVGTLVCYEGIFPELGRDYVNAGARILVNITNDAWFGRSSAPYQHLSIAVFRAIETRTPMIRAANTGITAIIDQNGHIDSMTGLFEETWRTGTILPGTADSLYLKIGDTLAWSCLALSLLVLTVAYRRHIPDSTQNTIPKE